MKKFKRNRFHRSKEDTSAGIFSRKIFVKKKSKPLGFFYDIREHGRIVKYLIEQWKRYYHRRDFWKGSDEV